jgi:hypothetical protein
MHNCSSAILKAQLHGRARHSRVRRRDCEQTACRGLCPLYHLDSGGAIAELSHGRIVLNIDGPNRSREKHRAIARGNP